MTSQSYRNSNDLGAYGAYSSNDHLEMPERRPKCDASLRPCGLRTFLPSFDPRALELPALAHLTSTLPRVAIDVCVAPQRNPQSIASPISRSTP